MDRRSLPTLPLAMKHTFKIFILLAVMAMVAAACSSSSDDTTTTTTTAAPTTTEATTTTTEAPTTTTTSTTTTTLAPGIAPTINGLPGDEGTEERRLIAIKIDNHPKARPQSGLQTADAAYEILVEGGLTRFIAMYQQSDDEYVGPNRSGRPTDAAVMAPLGGAFQISGAQGWVRDIFKKNGVHVVYDNGVTTWRMNHRKAPHNLYTSSVKIRAYADQQGWPDEAPPSLFVYSNDPTPTTEPAETITLDWSNHPVVVWKWDGEQYLRFNKTKPHEWVDADGKTGQVAFNTIVVIEGHKYTANAPGGDGSSVPAIKTVGSGQALVFSAAACTKRSGSVTR